MSGTECTAPTYSGRASGRGSTPTRGRLSSDAPLGACGRGENQRSNHSDGDCEVKPMFHTLTLIRLQRPIDYFSLAKRKSNAAQSQVGVRGSPRGLELLPVRLQL